MRKILLFGALFMMSSTAWAVTVKNVSSQPVTYGIGSYQTTLQPGESAEMSVDEADHPRVRSLVRAGKLIIEPTKLSVDYCNSYEADEYCFMDLATQEESAIYCAYFDMWSSAKECLYYVNQKKKLVERDCWGFDPGSSNRTQCMEYVKSGIPSKPGQSYEASQKL